MGADIPCFPDTSGSKLMVFAHRGTGYVPSSSGAHYPLIHRVDVDLVSILEMETCLKHLGFKSEAFWLIEDHSEPIPANTVPPQGD